MLGGILGSMLGGVSASGFGTGFLIQSFKDIHGAAADDNPVSGAVLRSQAHEVIVTPQIPDSLWPICNAPLIPAYWTFAASAARWSCLALGGAE